MRSNMYKTASERSQDLLPVPFNRISDISTTYHYHSITVPHEIPFNDQKLFPLQSSVGKTGLGVRTFEKQIFSGEQTFPSRRRPGMVP